MDMPGFSDVWLFSWKPGWDSAPLEWKAELEAEKALGFGHAWDCVKTRAITIRVYLGFWEI